MGAVIANCCFCGCGNCGWQCGGCKLPPVVSVTMQCGDCDSPVGTGTATTATTGCAGLPLGCLAGDKGEVTFHVNLCNEGGPYDCDTIFVLTCTDCDCGFGTPVLTPSCFLLNICSVNGNAGDGGNPDSGFGWGGGLCDGGSCDPLLLTFHLSEFGFGAIQAPLPTCLCNELTIFITEPS